MILFDLNTNENLGKLLREAVKCINSLFVQCLMLQCQGLCKQLIDCISDEWR